MLLGFEFWDKSIKAKSNPYDESFKQYFEEREGVKMLSGVNGRQELLKIWKRRKGICPICNEPINTETPWKFHKEGQGNKTIWQLLHTRCTIKYTTTIFSLSPFSTTIENVERLEPYEGKLSRTVLRGESDSNVTFLTVARARQFD